MPAPNQAILSKSIPKDAAAWDVDGVRSDTTSIFGSGNVNDSGGSDDAAVGDRYIAAVVYVSSNILLDGSVTSHDGVTLENGMIALMNGQTDQTENGPYIVSTTSDWVRASFVVRDIRLVLITDGTYKDGLYKLDQIDTAEIGTDTITYTLVKARIDTGILTYIEAGLGIPAARLISIGNPTTSTPPSGTPTTGDIDGIVPESGVDYILIANSDPDADDEGYYLYNDSGDWALIAGINARIALGMSVSIADGIRYCGTQWAKLRTLFDTVATWRQLPIGVTDLRESSGSATPTLASGATYTAVAGSGSNAVFASEFVFNTGTDAVAVYISGIYEVEFAMKVTLPTASVGALTLEVRINGNPQGVSGSALFNYGAGQTPPSTTLYICKKLQILASTPLSFTDEITFTMTNSIAGTSTLFNISSWEASIHLISRL